MIEHVAKLERSKFTDVIWERERGPDEKVAPFVRGRLIERLEPISKKRIARADWWRRIFARLAGVGDATYTFTRRPFTHEDGAIWVTAWFEHPHHERKLMFGRVIVPNDAELQDHVVPTPMRQACANEASRNVGSEWSFGLAWGELGSSEAKWTSVVRLPGRKRAARSLVCAHFNEAKAGIRDAIDRKNHLESFLPHFVAYLLHEGHGELAGRSWSNCAREFYGMSEACAEDPANESAVGPATARALRTEIDTVRKDVTAARKLVNGWRRIGQP